MPDCHAPEHWRWTTRLTDADATSGVLPSDIGRDLARVDRQITAAIVYS